MSTGHASCYDEEAFHRLTLPSPHKEERALGTEKLGLKKWKRASSPRDAKVLAMSMVHMDVCVGRLSKLEVFQLDSSAENSSSHGTLGNMVFPHRWFQFHSSVFKFF